MKPLLITFEGLDGSGKSTQLGLVRQWLSDAGVAFTVTHEPGGTAFGQELRRLFLEAREGEMDGVEELLLVFASRRRHLTEVIDPALERGKHVLCDRFTDSTFAYQGYGRGIASETIAVVDEIATGSRLPNRTILFDLPAEEARRRGASRRDRRGGDIADRLDREVLEFYQRVRRGFLDRAAAEPARFVVVDAQQSIGDTFADLKHGLADLVGGQGES